MNRYILMSLGVVAVLARAVHAATDAATVLQKQGQATLSVAAEVTNGQVDIRLSDQLRLIVTMEGPAELEVKPLALTRTEAWKVASAERPKSVILETGRCRWQQTLVLDPLAPGKSNVQLEPLQYREKAGDWARVEWKPIAVEVSTQITRADVNELRDITDVETLPARPGNLTLILTIAGIAAAVVLVLVVWLRRRRRRKTGPALTPAQWALHELDRILSLDLPAAGAVDRLHTLLSNVIRRYLENRFALPARRQTTPEFLQTMQQSPHLSAAQQTLLGDFLRRCDLAKFARAHLSAEECQASAAMARQFVEQTANPGAGTAHTRP